MHYLQALFRMGIVCTPLLCGCTAARPERTVDPIPTVIESHEDLDANDQDSVVQTSAQQDAAPTDSSAEDSQDEPAPANDSAKDQEPDPAETKNKSESDEDVDKLSDIELKDVIESIHSTFPLLEAAYQENEIAAGNQLAALGAFDTKLKASSENGALGFYETHRNRAGFSQPIYEGGEVFAGYRVGRGNFEPWYLERQTNDGGEFKTGVNIPLARNRDIDARRAALWRADYDRQRAIPEIKIQLIRFVRDGSVMYWKWIAAGQQYEVGQQALELAKQRNDQLKRKVEVGDLAPPVLQDNLRAIAKREAKLIDLRRKYDQASYKLSLFLRNTNGLPIVPRSTQKSNFPDPTEPNDLKLDTDISTALAERPELTALDALAQRFGVDLAEAQNLLLPSVNAQIVGAQDVGEPSSSKRDKSEFEIEAAIMVDVPIQRRKARGKAFAAQGKIAQITAKRRFSEDKIRQEVQSAHVALKAAFERLGRARESKRLADFMANVERRKFDLGQSDLLAVVLREQAAIDAAEAVVDALLEFFSSKADYDAAMARDWPQARD